MKLTIESTPRQTTFESPGRSGVEVRVWRGVTAAGVECFVFVHRIAVVVEAEQEEFLLELCEKDPPSGPERVPLHVVLGQRRKKPFRIDPKGD